MSRMISKELMEATLKTEMYLERMNDIHSNEEFDINWYNDFYDPQGIHVSERDRLCREYYINNLLFKKYDELSEALSKEIKRLKKSHNK